MGTDDASLRAIARRVGITHQSVAHHFADRRTLLTAVAATGFAQLAELGREAVAQVPDDSRLGSRAIAVGITYARFAEENRPLFNLMLDAERVDEASAEFIARRSEMWGMLLGTVRAETDRGWGGSVDPVLMSVMVWSLVHGIAGIHSQLPIDIEVVDLLTLLNTAIAGGDPAAQ